jgi:RNA polymerase-binding transcription factor DksA
MSYLSQALLKELQTELGNRFLQLRQDIIDILMNSTNSSDHLTALQMPNMSSDELLDITSRFPQPPISSKTSSMKSIDAALNNIEIDMYGLCADCEKEIGIEQLKLEPTKQRCSVCERKYQKQKYNNFKL